MPRERFYDPVTREYLSAASEPLVHELRAQGGASRVGRGGPDADAADAYYREHDRAVARAPLAAELDGIHRRIVLGVIALVSIVLVMGSVLVATTQRLKETRADRLHWARVAEWEWAERNGCHVVGTRPSECAAIEAGAPYPAVRP